MTKTNGNQQETSAAHVLIESITKSIETWPDWFVDLVEGKDIRMWQQHALDCLAPIALNGFETGALRISGLFREGDAVDMVAPAFFSKSSTDTAVGPGGKAKLKGLSKGLLFFMGNELGMVHEVGSSYLLYRTTPGEVKAAYGVKIAFSLSSMTSAGPGYEIILEDGPLVFRLALAFQRYSSRQSDFETLLQKLVSETCSD